VIITEKLGYGVLFLVAGVCFFGVAQTALILIAG
jgi:hypothetical protein